eukprot:1148138-Pelagomonas_calceolata.AAC.1
MGWDGMRACMPGRPAGHYSPALAQVHIAFCLCSRFRAFDANAKLAASRDLELGCLADTGCGLPCLN